MGPARALEEREKFKKNTHFFKHMFIKTIVVSDLYMTFFNGFYVFFRFLAEIRFRTIMKLPQKTNSRTKMCSFGTSITLP